MFTYFKSTGNAHAMRSAAGALSYFWRARGDVNEGIALVEHALSIGDDGSSSARAAALFGLAGLLYAKGEEERSYSCAREALSVARALGDARRMAAAGQLCGLLARRFREWDVATAYQREALSAVESFSGTAVANGLEMMIRGHLAHLALAQGHLNAAEATLLELFERQRGLGFEPGTGHLFANDALAYYGDIARGRGENELALSRYRAALRGAQQQGQRPSQLYATGGVAGAMAAMGEWASAARLFGAIEAYCDRFGLSFAQSCFDRQRALGLPEPWMRVSEPVGNLEELRAAVLELKSPLSPIPYPALAAERWAEGRTLTIEQAMTEALDETDAQAVEGAYS
jgi:hypothetical protein